MKLSKIAGKVLLNYYRAFDHPFKLRIFFGINRLLNFFNYRIVIPYYNDRLFISLNLTDYIDRVIFQNGEYEAKVSNSLFLNIVKDEILWDIGGHIGSFALKALSREEINKIYCFEPNPVIFKVLNQNRSLNDAGQRLEIFNFGLGDENTQLPYLAVKKGNSGGGKFSTAGVGSVETLPVCTIDELVFNKGLLPPSLIKIDVEGFELKVFEGAKKTFELYPPKAIIFEGACKDGQPGDLLLTEFLRAYNYRLSVVRCEDEYGGPFENFLAVKQ